MNAAQQALDLLRHKMTGNDLQCLSETERQQFAEICYHWQQLAQTPGAARRLPSPDESPCIEATDIDSARIELDATEVLAAIANAIEVLAASPTPPQKLFSTTIPQLAGHAVYLANTLENDMGCFIDLVERTTEAV